MNSTTYHAVAFTFIVGAYAAKIALVRSRFSNAAICAFLILGIGATLPVIYRFSDTWTNRSMSSPLLIWIGEPILFFGVPVASLFIDMAGRTRSRSRSLWPYHIVRSAAEFAFAVTFWGAAWEFAMLMLGWLWI
jgi:hypothetical protein